MIELKIESVQEIQEQFKLDSRGFLSLDKTRQPITDIETIKECVAVIPSIFQSPHQTTTRYKMNSYKGKHIVEKQLGKYVSNGEFIIAMILLEYRFQAISKSLNCLFICKERK